MNITLRIFLVILSLGAFLLCISKIKQSKLKVANSVLWMIGSIVLILMSIFTDAVKWISDKLGFMAPVNFVFFVMIGFLLMQIFIDNMRISTLNEKIKNLDHYLALKEYKEKNKTEDK